MNLTFRKAEWEDVPEIVQFLADDKLGALREDYQQPLPNQYLKFKGSQTLTYVQYGAFLAGSISISET